MIFCTLIAQEVWHLVAFLKKKGIPFEIIFNEEGAKAELEPSPGNNILYSELRTKTYLAQHFYAEVSEEYLINNPKTENKILRFITKDHFEDIERSEEDNLIPIDDQKIINKKNSKTKWIQRIFALLFLASMLYTMIQSLLK